MSAYSPDIRERINSNDLITDTFILDGTAAKKAERETHAFFSRMLHYHYNDTPKNKIKNCGWCIVL